MREYSFGETILEAKNINLSFGTKQILRDVNFSIKDIKRPGHIKGQIISLLGPSGVGKTQLFKIISAMNPPTSGEVLLHGKPVHQGQIGVVAQNYPLFKHLTVDKNLCLAHRHHGCDHKGEKGNCEKIVSWLERFNLVDSKSKYPAQLSGGQRQRIAIAQQMLCSEKFVLLDEPFSGLDDLNLMNTVHTLMEIANSDDLNTIIVVTHDVLAAVLISDIIWLIGYEKDDKGNSLPGARILQEINLMDMDLAWEPNMEQTDKYVKFVRDLKMSLKQLI